MGYDFIKAKDARKPIKNMLMGKGGSALVLLEDKTTRMLVHDFLNRPRITLLWPLSLLQPHSVRYRVDEGDVTVEETTFARGQVNTAISKFLDGIPPDQDITIRHESD